MNVIQLAEAVDEIKTLMVENTDYLVKLDARFGDGDLGISMSRGFMSAAKALKESNTQDQDLGIALKAAANAFNEAAPSTLGTIMSFLLMGMAKSLRGLEDADLKDIAAAMENGLHMIMDKAKSKPGDKTILDSLYPGVEALLSNVENGKEKAFAKALKAAEAGLENTKNMKSRHGRSAYYGGKTVGEIDGGAVVGMLIFKGLSQYAGK